jgi:hypothetical protein
MIQLPSERLPHLPKSLVEAQEVLVTVDKVKGPHHLADTVHRELRHPDIRHGDARHLRDATNDEEEVEEGGVIHGADGAATGTVISNNKVLQRDLSLASDLLSNKSGEAIRCVSGGQVRRSTAGGERRDR